jgi:hypothetical protein
MMALFMCVVLILANQIILALNCVYVPRGELPTSAHISCMSSPTVTGNTVNTIFYPLLRLVIWFD